MNKNTISKWFSMFLLMMVAGITGATAQSLTVADFTLEQGQMTEVNIKLAAPADQTIYGVQTDITLSEGLILEEVAAVNAELQFDKNIVAGGATRVALLSLAGASIPAGDVIKLHVKAADNFAGGTIALTNSKLTTSTAGAESSVADATATVKMSPRKIEKKIAMTGEITSLEALAGAKFMLQNEAGFVLYTPDGWDVKVAKPVTATSNKGNGGFFTLVALDGDHAGQYQVPIWNLDGSRRKFWAGEQYLNAQPGGNVIFGLDGTAPNYGQDGTNLALWTITYEANKGFAFHCVGRDIYLGNDNTAARPSETVVYWKAYTGYDALYDEADILAAYAMDAPLVKLTEAATALSTAKTAYETDNDIEKFGDALNAAIDVVKTCMALNEAYAHLDATGAAAAAEVLAKYNAGEYANIAELRAAYILAAKAQSTPGANMTLAIVNPSFEFGTIEGWTSKDGGDIANNYNFAQRTGDKFCERWTGAPGKLSDGSFLQVIKGLPYGKYKLTAELQNREQGNGDAAGKGLFLVANEGKTECVAKDGTTFEVVGTTKRGGVLEIGIKLEGCTGNWICFDNFQLTFVEAVAAPAETTATFDFAAEGFREKVGTSLTDVNGIVYNETFTADGATLQVTSGSAASKLYVDTNRGQNLVTYPQYATLTFKAPEGKAIVQIDFTAAGNSNINKLTPSSGAVEGMIWTGNAEGVRFTQGATSYLANAVLTLVDKTDETAALPAIEYTECANIAAFNALAAGTYAKITLTNAEVIGKSADGYSTVWMQDATGGCWIQYTSLNDKLAEKTKVNGTVYAVLRATSGNTQMKEAEATLQSELNATAIESYTAVAGTIAEVNVAANLNKVVKIAADSLVMTKASSGTLYVGETSITVNNGTATANQLLCKIADWEQGKKLENITIEAILSASSATANQLLPISIEETEVEPEDTYATVKMTYVSNNSEEGDADKAFGEVTEAKAGFNKIENGQVGFGNTTWNRNYITYISVDTKDLQGIVKKATLKAKLSGTIDENKRVAVWGVGYNNSVWSADMTYNTADKSITLIDGATYTTKSKNADTFEDVELDITEAFKDGAKTTTLVVYETAAAGAIIKDVAVQVEMGWPEIEKNGIIYAVKGDNLIANASFDEGFTGWTQANDFATTITSDGFEIRNEEGHATFLVGTKNEGAGGANSLGTAWSIEPGKTYYYAYDVKSLNDLTKAEYLKSSLTNAKGDETVVIDMPNVTPGEWTSFEYIFTNSENYQYLQTKFRWLAGNFGLDNFKLYELEMLTSALDAAKATKIAAIDALAPIGEGLFFYSQRSIDDAKAAVNAAETVEAVEAVAMPTPTVPAADKEYTFFNKQAQRYMTLSAEGISIAEEPYNLKFEAAEGGKYYVTDGTNYVGLAGTDNWSMTTAADKKEALTISATFVGNEAYYTLAESKGLVGVDYPKKDNMGCWANKGTGDGDAVLWSIAEKKDRFAITIAETQNGTAVAKPTSAAEGETVTLIATPAEGYMVDAVKVTYGESQEVELNKNATADTITFVMPASAVTATFTFKLTPIATAKAALEATLATAKAIETEGKNGADALNAAITPAETALNAADATIESLAAAKEALAQAISVFNKANLDADLVEIAQNQGKDIQDGATRATLIEGEGYNTYTTDASVCVIFKMYDVNVKDCDYVLVKFAEPVPAGIKIAFWAQSGTANVDVPAGATEYKYVFAEDNQCAIANDILPQITLLTLWNAQTVKVEGVYKHNTVIATGINTIANDAQKNTIFNLNGQKVNKAQRGLYIINGKRVMVK